MMLQVRDLQKINANLSELTVKRIIYHHNYHLHNGIQFPKAYNFGRIKKQVHMYEWPRYGKDKKGLPKNI